MKTYIVLLRGINVSGKNKLPMKELREMLEKLNFTNVSTYIQSGNIILQSEATKEEVSKNIHEAIQSEFGYDIPVIIRTPNQWKKVIENYPFSKENEKIVAFSFLNNSVQEKEIEVKGINDDQYKIDNDIVYLYCPSGFGKTKLTNNILEKKLNVVATTRNLKTTLKLWELLKEIN
jgi:uncharacterized protein (DUF1697 family)